MTIANKKSPTASARTSSAAPSSAGIVGRAFERFLEMPVRLVIGVLWLSGAALMGSWALVVYLVVRELI
jgi:hypothetical protein